MTANLPRMNLSKASVLLFEPNGQNMQIFTQVLLGFGARTFLRCQNADQAKAAVDKTSVDLMIVEGQSPEGDPEGFDFVHWLRRSDLEPNAFTPVIITSAHTSKSNVSRARDCGAHFIISKPIVPNILFERILWVARTNRAFVNAGSYLGPDRRFRNDGPPEGIEGRRATDLKGVSNRPDSSSKQETDNPMPSKQVAI
jgi:DNA-binding response OmpR family regulator